MRVADLKVILGLQRDLLETCSSHRVCEVEIRMSHGLHAGVNHAARIQKGAGKKFNGGNDQGAASTPIGCRFVATADSLLGQKLGSTVARRTGGNEIGAQK